MFLIWKISSDVLSIEERAGVEKVNERIFPARDLGRNSCNENVASLQMSNARTDLLHETNVSEFHGAVYFSVSWYHESWNLKSWKAVRNVPAAIKWIPSHGFPEIVKPPTGILSHSTELDPWFSMRLRILVIWALLLLPFSRRKNEYYIPAVNFLGKRGAKILLRGSTLSLVQTETNGDTKLTFFADARMILKVFVSAYQGLNLT